MTRCLADPHPDIRARAAHGLGLLGDPASAEDLIRATRDPEWPVRVMAAKALRIANGCEVREGRVVRIGLPDRPVPVFQAAASAGARSVRS